MKWQKQKEFALLDRVDDGFNFSWITDWKNLNQMTAII